MADGGHNLSTAELLALLRDASLKPDSIAEEMECAGAHRCTAEQIAEARELLGLLQQERTAQSAGLASEGAAAEAEVARRIAALPEPLALALVRAAGEAQRQDALVELAAAPQKALAKEAKRELQKLKQRGFQVQELKPRARTVHHGDGNRAIQFHDRGREPVRENGVETGDAAPVGLLGRRGHRMRSGYCRL